MSDDEDLYPATFDGECTCEHDRDDHGWGGCGNDGCTCEAGWCE